MSKQRIESRPMMVRNAEPNGSNGGAPVVVGKLDCFRAPYPVQVPWLEHQPQSFVPGSDGIESVGLLNTGAVWVVFEQGHNLFLLAQGYGYREATKS